MLDALSRQDGWHMRMQQLAPRHRAVPSATTRLVNRLEDRELLTRSCARTIGAASTPSSHRPASELLDEARPTHDATLEAALDRAADIPELAHLARALHEVPA